MSTAIIKAPGDLESWRPEAAAVVPWRDPHHARGKDLTRYIEELELACQARPESAALRVCLGVAHAVNLDVYRSMDTLEEAVRIEPDNFWARLKYAELHYRLRVLNRAEEETRKAADVATNRMQLALARQQMREIRTLQHTSVRNVSWTKPLTTPALVLALMFAAVCVLMSWQ
jgi:tetratricopeptide (TPR) repeat protein